MSFEDEIDVPADAPQELKDFNNLSDQDNYEEELARLLNYLGKQFQIGNLADANGDLAAVIPKYQSKADVPTDELGAAAYPDTALVHVEGEGVMAITDTA